MSLVSEALRKARREAAVQEAVRQGRVVPANLLEVPRRRRRLGRLAVVLALVAAAGAAGALSAWWFRGRIEPPASAPAILPAEAPAPGAEPLATPVEAGDLSPRIEPSPQPTPSQHPRQAERAADAAPDPSPVDRARTQETPPRDDGKAPQIETDRVFVIDADLGKVKLHLDFIVYKPSAPFAGINGVQIVPGSIVDGLLVEEIGADFVRLRDARGTLTLRVR